MPFTSVRFCYGTWCWVDRDGKVKLQLFGRLIFFRWLGLNWPKQRNLQFVHLNKNVSPFFWCSRIINRYMLIALSKYLMLCFTIVLTYFGLRFLETWISNIIFKCFNPLKMKAIQGLFFLNDVYFKCRLVIGWLRNTCEIHIFN